jgi:hypothetical protein
VVLPIRTSRLGVSAFQALHGRVISVIGFARWTCFGLVWFGIIASRRRFVTMSMLGFVAN